MPVSGYSIGTHGDPLLTANWRFKQFSLLRTSQQLLREQARAGTSLGVKLAQLRNGFLHHLAATPHRAHHPPVGTRVPTFAHLCVPQIHPHHPALQLSPQSRAGASTCGWHYTPILPVQLEKLSVSLEPDRSKIFLADRTVEVRLTDSRRAYR